jgi:hypothetical protein
MKYHLGSNYIGVMMLNFSTLGMELDKAAKENLALSLKTGPILNVNLQAARILSSRIRRICTFECMVIENDVGYSVIIDEKRREFEVLMACYAAGLRISEISILEGSYSQACCLLRQDIESLTHLTHVLKDTRKGKKAPNIAVLELQMKKVYSDLTEVAHLTSDEILRDFSALSHHHPADRITLPMGADCLPCYRRGVCNVLLGIRALTMICIIGVLEKYIKMYFPHLVMSSETMEELKSEYKKLSMEIPELCEHPLDFEVIF